MIHPNFLGKSYFYVLPGYLGTPTIPFFVFTFHSSSKQKSVKIVHLVGTIPETLTYVLLSWDNFNRSD